LPTPLIETSARAARSCSAITLPLPDTFSARSPTWPASCASPGAEMSKAQRPRSQVVEAHGARARDRDAEPVALDAARRAWMSLAPDRVSWLSRRICTSSWTRFLLQNFHAPPGRSTSRPPLELDLDAALHVGVAGDEDLVAVALASAHLRRAVHLDAVERARRVEPALGCLAPRRPVTQPGTRARRGIGQVGHIAWSRSFLETSRLAVIACRRASSPPAASSRRASSPRRNRG
jgi:hypothetical protein